MAFDDTTLAALKSEGLSDAELAYMNSGGATTDGLERPAEAEIAKPEAEVVKPAADTTKVDAGAKPDAAAKVVDEDEGEEIEVPTKGKRRMVNYAALREAKKKIADLEEGSKKTAAELAAERDLRARVDERLKLLGEVMKPEAQAQVDEDPEPDPDTDVIAHNRWLSRQLRKSQESVTTTQKTLAARDEDAAIHRDYLSDAGAFIAKEPNFGGDKGAYQFLLNTRGQQLRMQGYPEKDITPMVLAEERNLVMRARENKISPAQMLFDLAKSMGWQAPAAPKLADAAAASATGAGKTETQASPGNLADAALAASAAKQNGNGSAKTEAKPSVTEEIERLNAGLAASRTLSSAGGASANPLSIEVLANLDNDEFAALYAKHGGEIDKLMKGVA